MHEAVVCFCKVITFRPKHPEARRLLALAHCTLGEVDKAVEVFEEWLKEEPDHPIAAAHAGGVLRSRRAGTGVGRVRREDLRQLRRQLRRQARQAAVPRPGAGRGDAGGLGRRGVEEPRRARCRMRHRACADRSSRRMRAGWWASTCPRACWLRPQARNVYDELFKAELTAYLRDNPGAFDVIVSADTLVYFGPLEAVAAAAAAALRPGGRLIFTVEELTDAGSDAGYALSLHGRYCHTRQYLERVLADANLRPEIVPAELRLEAGDPVAGLVVRATKPAAREELNHA